MDEEDKKKMIQAFKNRIKELKELRKKINHKFDKHHDEFTEKWDIINFRKRDLKNEIKWYESEDPDIQAEIEQYVPYEECIKDNPNLEKLDFEKEKKKSYNPIDFLNETKEKFYRLKDNINKLGGNYPSSYYPIKNCDEIIKNIDLLLNFLYET